MAKYHIQSVSITLICRSMSDFGLWWQTITLTYFWVCTTGPLAKRWQTVTLNYLEGLASGPMAKYQIQSVSLILISRSVSDLDLWWQIVTLTYLGGLASGPWSIGLWSTCKEIAISDPDLPVPWKIGLLSTGKEMANSDLDLPWRIGLWSIGKKMANSDLDLQ